MALVHIWDLGAGREQAKEEHRNGKDYKIKVEAKIPFIMQITSGRAGGMPLTCSLNI